MHKIALIYNINENKVHFKTAVTPILSVFRPFQQKS